MSCACFASLQRGLRWVPLLCLVFASSAVHAATSAEDKAAAQALYDRALLLMQSGDYALACDLLAESQRIDAQQVTEFALATCYERAGKTASAWATWLELADVAANSDKPDALERSTYARSKAAALEPTLARLVVRVPHEVVGLEVTRNGVPIRRVQWGLPLPVDPGVHVLRAFAPGKRAWSAEIDVTGPATQRVIEVPALSDAPTQREPRPARLSITSNANHTIFVDGKFVGVQLWEGPVSAGEHDVRAVGQGRPPFATRVTLAPGERRQIRVELPADSGHGLPTWVWVLGGAAFAGGLVAGGYLLFRSDQEASRPPATNIPPFTVQMPLTGGVR